MTDEQKPQQIAPYAPYKSVRMVGMGDLVIYTVSDDELRMIESGGPAATLLNLALVLLSVGASLLGSLLLGSTKSIYSFTVVVVITAVTLVVGLVLLVLWIRSAADAKSVIQRIRARASAQVPEAIPIEVSKSQ
jgi:hypothetical protein